MAFAIKGIRKDNVKQYAGAARSHFAARSFVHRNQRLREYHHKISEGLTIHQQLVPVLFYYTMTGLHVLHMTGGLCFQHVRADAGAPRLL